MSNQHRQHHQVILILDIDGTLTQKDTLHLVAQAGYQRQKIASANNNDNNDVENDKSTTEISPRPRPRPRPPIPWPQIVDAYIADYNAHVSGYQPTKQSRTRLAQEIAWLNSLQRIETASATRAYDAGIFKGVRTSDFERVAREAVRTGEVRFRKGWFELITRICTSASASASKSTRMMRGALQVEGGCHGSKIDDEEVVVVVAENVKDEKDNENKNEDEGKNEGEELPRSQPQPQPQSPIQIVSVNWSASFILAALGHAAIQVDPSLKSSFSSLSSSPSSPDWSNIHNRLLRHISISANEFPITHDNDSDNRINQDMTFAALMDKVNIQRKSIRTSGDKNECILQIKQSCSHSSASTQSMIVYIGDSTTDLECLVGADVGVCIRDEPMGSGQKELAETCERVGIRVEWVGEYGRVINTTDTSEEKRLWWARDFDEIGEFVKKLVSRAEGQGEL